MTENKRINGKVKLYITSKYYGFVTDENETDYFFHNDDVEDRVILKPGFAVSFIPEQKPKGKCATKIRIVDKDKEQHSFDAEYLKAIKEISKWKLEAKLENASKYFYQTSDLDLIETGDKCYVIGRKGSGKTAIAEWLYGKSEFNYFTQKLSFKNFPFNELYKLTDNKYTPPNQYITLWKYIIYSSLIRCMIQNQNIDLSLREKLENICPNELKTSLQRTITKWIGGGFKFNILGTGIEISATKSTHINDTPWIDRVVILEEIIEKYIDCSNYFIIFDELDEDYKSDANKKTYLDLLTSLFKAVQDIKSIFRSDNYSIFPVIFIRDDIYNQIKDTDKSKWSDMGIWLCWDTDKIKNMLAFRISKSIDSLREIMKFHEAWQKIIVSKYITTMSKFNMDIFDYISERTFLRPRDYIHYLKCCADISLTCNYKINSEIINKAYKTYSYHFRTEIEDEIEGIFPDIRNILDLLSHIRKLEFNSAEFIRKYEEFIKTGKVENRSPEFVLNILFNFSIIGNVTKAGSEIFRYTKNTASFNINESLRVHKGLRWALNIYT